jgi:hypothetical protein
MDRCPHCKAPGPTRPLCRVCGLPVDEPPPADGLLAGLEPTRVPAVEVQAARLDGLERTEDVLGDVSIPDLAPDGPAGHCARCGAPVGSEHFCERCGFALVPKADRRGEPPPVRCLSCGVPNRPDAVNCAACGQRLNP